MKARRLRFAGGVPFGYDFDERTKQLAPNETEAAVVKGMFSEATSGRKPSEIVEAANARGCRTKVPVGGPWSARQVRATLRNPVHFGVLKDGRSFRLGCHLAIVSHELFDAAGSALDKRLTRKAKSVRYGPMWPLKGRLECGTCRRPLSPHSTRHGNKVYRYYRCRAAAVGRSPCGYQEPVGPLENAVDSQLPDRTRDDIISQWIRQHVDHVVYDPTSGRVEIEWLLTHGNGNSARSVAWTGRFDQRAGHCDGTVGIFAVAVGSDLASELGRDRRAADHDLDLAADAGIFQSVDGCAH